MRALAIAVAVIFLLQFNTGCGQNKRAEDSQAYQDSVAAAKLEADMAKYDRYWDDYARFLGGMPPLQGSKLDSLERTPEAIAHRKAFDEIWARKEKNLLSDLALWSQKELPTEYKNTRTAFYPFSGADFLTINTIYPVAEQYVLFGLEKEGITPEIKKMPQAKLQVNLTNLQFSMRHVMSVTFYKTLEMSKDLHTLELSGTTPHLLAFMSRTGHRILDVNHVRVTPQGQLEKMAKSLHQTPMGDTTVTGIMIDFRKDKGPKRTLVYLSVNVQNQYMNMGHQQRAFVRYIRGLKPTSTYIKAASYLMYGYDFSQIKDLIQDVSETILQDDSGMPLRAYDTKMWDLKFYGRYTRPIDLFASKYQPDLFKVYQDTTIKPLGFGIGYMFAKGSSNLMIARKKAPAPTPAPTKADSVKSAAVPPPAEKK